MPACADPASGQEAFSNPASYGDRVRPQRRGCVGDTHVFLVLTCFYCGCLHVTGIGRPIF